MADVQVLTTTGKDIGLSPTTVQAFKESLRGNLLCRDEPGYDPARKVFNATVDKYPALIARCAGAADVVRAVTFAREHDLYVAVRGGGHDLAGYSVCQDGLLIDLSPMKGIRVDPRHQTVHAQGGVTWGDFDQETTTFGLATPGGMVSTHKRQD